MVSDNQQVKDRRLIQGDSFSLHSLQIAPDYYVNSYNYARLDSNDEITIAEDCYTLQ